MASADFLTIGEIVEAARANLSREAWGHATSGTEAETTLRRNRSAFEAVGLNPRVLTGVGKRDTSTTFLGHKLALPVMIAPVGPIVNFHPEGVLAAARAAAQAGTAAFAATSSFPSIEKVRAGADCPLFFQLYIRGDGDWLRQIVRRAEEAGCAAIVPTVDTPAHSRLDRDIENRFVPLRGRRAPNQEGLPEYSAEQKEAFAAGLTWDVIDDLRSITKLPIVIKGIMNPRDAELALEHGADAVYISNHGGRALDGSPATIEVLPEIMQAVAGRVEVIVDSGFMRGTDVVKALALGAKAVCIGKLTAFGLGAAGTDGVAAVLEILRDELDGAMAYLGAGTVAELGPHNLRPAMPPPSAMWPYLDLRAATSPTSGV